MPSFLLTASVWRVNTHSPADSEEMKVKVEYTFHASVLGGKDLVTFEELYDLSDKNEPVKVAEHKDIEDDGRRYPSKSVLLNPYHRCGQSHG